MIIHLPKEIVGQFVADILGDHNNWGNYNAIADVDDKGMRVGVIYNNFTSKTNGLFQSCCMHVAARPGARWATREFLHHAFYYPFVQLGCERVTGLVDRKNKKARKFDEHLGFEYEAMLKRNTEKGDTVVYRMFAEKCRWINMKPKNELDPNKLIPLHKAWDESRINDLVASMQEKGWTERPVLVLNTDNRNYALTGTHRIEAARRTGITVPVHYVDTAKTTNSLLARMLREAGDHEAAFLVEVEMYESGAE